MGKTEPLHLPDAAVNRSDDDPAFVEEFEVAREGRDLVARISPESGLNAAFISRWSTEPIVATEPPAVCVSSTATRVWRS
jgi:hypothetical protein